MCAHRCIGLGLQSVFDLDTEPLGADANVVKLNETLCAMEEHISPYLPHVKVQYVVRLLQGYDTLTAMPCVTRLLYLHPFQICV